MVQPGPRTCPNCSRVVAAQHRFCENCGAPLPAAPVQGTPVQGAPAQGGGPHSRRLLIALVAAVVAAVVAVVAVVATRDGEDDRAAAPTTPSAPLTSADQITDLQTHAYPAGRHVTSAVDYPESPPVGGDHDPEWADCTGTVYDVAIRPENAVHALEHGATWITYDPAAVSDDDVATLAALVDGIGGRMLSPYPGLSSAVSLQAWGHQLFLDSADDARVAQFADLLTYGEATPEPGASCENPQFLSDPLADGDDSRVGSATATDAPAGGSGAGTVSCDYVPATGGGTAIDVGTPPDPAATPATGTAVLRMSTGQGDLTLTLDRSLAPCAAASFTFLAGQGFFDGSPCHREVNQPSFGVLQCGDPTGTGTGGPGYRFDQEVTAATSYPRGTIAMANSGAATTTGSQFFLCFVDTLLSPDYTAVGTVDQAGLAVLDGIAAAGNDGSFEPSPGGGAPATPVVIASMSVVG